MERQINLTVTGKVQNVGFRFFTEKKAVETHIKGYVKNLPDGGVYIEAQGEEKDLQTFKDFIMTGPKWCRVDKVYEQEVPPSGYQDFSIRY
jgi:acylphosphatase